MSLRTLAVSFVGTALALGAAWAVASRHARSAPSVGDDASVAGPSIAPAVDARAPEPTRAEASILDSSVAGASVLTRSKHDPCAGTISGALTDEVLAELMVRGYDRAQGRVPVVVPDAGNVWPSVPFTGCTGRVVKAIASLLPSPENRPEGAVGITRLAITGDGPRDEAADESLVVWAIVGELGGLCTLRTGFLGVVTRTGDRVRVEALGPWNGTCATETLAVTFLKVAGRGAILEAVGGSGEDGVSSGEVAVRMPVGRELAVVGLVPTGFEVWNHEPGKAEPGFSAALEGHPRGVLARQTWWLEQDAGRLTKERTLVYELHGNKLTTPANAPPAFD